VACTHLGRIVLRELHSDSIHAPGPVSVLLAGDARLPMHEVHAVVVALHGPCLVLWGGGGGGEGRGERERGEGVSGARQGQGSSKEEDEVTHEILCSTRQQYSTRERYSSFARELCTDIATVTYMETRWVIASPVLALFSQPVRGDRRGRWRG